MVRTDLEPEAGRARVRELERFRAAILSALDWPQPSGKLEVVLFREFDELADFRAGPVFGFLSHASTGALLVCAEETFADESWGRGSVRAHELTHYLSFFSIVRQPRWFAEGLAGYFGTLNFDAQGRAAIGVPSRQMTATVLRAGRPLPLEALWRWGSMASDEESAAQAPLMYASSWMWVHALRNLYPRELADFQRRLGLAQDPEGAFRSAFAAVPMEVLDRQVVAYAVAPAQPALISMPELDPRLSERELSDAEFHLARARVLLAIPRNGGENRRRALEEVRAALRLERSNLDARLLELRLTMRPSERLALARQLVQERPDSGEAWLSIGTALSELAVESAERESAFARALSLSPSSAVVLDETAFEYAGSKRAEEALTLAQRAVLLEPWHPGRLDTYAFVLNALGRCADAVDQETRAIELLPEGVGHQVRSEMQFRLNRYRRACGVPEDDGPDRLK